MKSAPDIQIVEEILEQCGIDWLLAEHRQQRLQQIAQEIEEASEEISRRLSLDSFRLIDEMRANPAALKPLIQLFASPTSTEMRSMVYCVLRGKEIKKIDFSYQLKTSVTLRVVLENEITGEELVFESDVVWDADILRHIGIMTMGTKPILHGFYAFG